MQLEVKGHAAATGEAAWSRYWAAGHAHSCPTSFAGFYGPQLQAFWGRQAAVLGPEDLALDLGCGNGALLRFFWSRFDAGRAPALVGVDAAELRPDWPAGPVMARVTIHPRTRFHALPLASESVSLAASLFGIEYANDEATWTELARVLRWRARVAFVLHKRGSHLDALAADEIVVARAALAADGVLALARALLPFLARAASDAGRVGLAGDREAEEVRGRFNAATETLANLSEFVKHGEYAHDILAALMKVLGEAGGGFGAMLGQRLETLRAGVADHLSRIEALRHCALDPAGVQAMRNRLQQGGFVLAPAATIAEQGYEMGWVLEGGRGYAG
ncbi:MAG TPA: class I SAM-dependent methyltransferase [Verrucomicrobiae bacterium]|nr:class I SAM-dependent methyltransferase [Verrucomicrobiae bacterium]